MGAGGGDEEEMEACLYPQGCLWLWQGGHIPVLLPAAGHCRLSNLARQSERLGPLEGQVCPRNKGI